MSVTKAASAIRREGGGGVPVGVAAGIAGGCEPAARYRLRKVRAGHIGEIEPGAEDLAKRIYRTFAKREVGRRCIEAVASVNRIGRFRPQGVKGEGMISERKISRDCRELLRSEDHIYIFLKM